jgi:hypothetical protein
MIRIQISAPYIYNAIVLPIKLSSRDIMSYFLLSYIFYKLIQIVYSLSFLNCLIHFIFIEKNYFLKSI